MKVAWLVEKQRTVFQSLRRTLCEKLSSFLRYLHFYHDYLVEKQFHKKAKVDFKIYDVTNWAKNNYNAYTVQYLQR